MSLSRHYSLKKFEIKGLNTDTKRQKGEKEPVETTAQKQSGAGKV